MPPPVMNRGQRLGTDGTKVGPGATVLRSDGSVIHEPQLLQNHSGNLTTTKANQVIKNLNITGRLIVQHPGCEVWDVKAKDFDVNVPSYPTANAKVYYSEFGSINGVQAEIAHRATGQGQLDLVRCNVYGYIDLNQVRCGTSRFVETWFHDLFDDPSDPGQQGSSHPDPIQFVGTDKCKGALGIRQILIEGCRFDSWTFKPGETINATGPSAHWGDTSNDKATAGLMLCKSENGGDPPNGVYVRDCYVDGNYSQLIYVVYNGTSSSRCPVNVYVFDNIFKKRANRANYGSGEYINLGAGCVITEGRNLDADTGEEIKIARNKYGTARVKQPGPPSSYPSYFVDNTDPGGGEDPGGEDPDPPGTVTITSPASGATLTDDFPFLAAFDDAADYNYMQYRLRGRGETEVGEIYIDRDQAPSNNGTTVQVTEDGAVVFDRALNANRTIPFGDYTLRVVGERKDLTFPFAEIPITIGTIVEEPPPTEPVISATAEITMDLQIEIDTSQGGVPDDDVLGYITPDPIPRHTYVARRISTGALLRWDPDINKFVEV